MNLTSINELLTQTSELKKASTELEKEAKFANVETVSHGDLLDKLYTAIQEQLIKLKETESRKSSDLAERFLKKLG